MTYRKGQRFHCINRVGKTSDVIVRRVTSTLVVFDILPTPYWWEDNGPAWNVRMKSADFMAWLKSMQAA